MTRHAGPPLDWMPGLARVVRNFTERDQALEANRDGEYVLWFEADLYDQLRELAYTSACARLTPAPLELATRAWAAFRAPTPAALGAIAAARLGELRFLGEAFDRLSRIRRRGTASR